MARIFYEYRYVDCKTFYTCLRRQVGAVIVDANNHIKSTGYNGIPSGLKHCVDHITEPSCRKFVKLRSRCDGLYSDLSQADLTLIRNVFGRYKAFDVEGVVNTVREFPEWKNTTIVGHDAILRMNGKSH